MTSADAALLARARELGVHTTYVDVHQQRHDADPDALATVVEMLDDDAAPDAAAVIDPVIVVRDAPEVGSTALGPARHRVTDAELLLSDGAVVVPPVAADGHTITVDAPLPLGCHELHVDTAAGPGAATVVCPPGTMLPRGPWHGGSGLFVPTYALWDHDAPLPSFGLLARLAHALGALGTDVVTTLPLYATFLDEPFEPSPYSPASRLHWSEAFIDDHALPAAPVPPLGRHLDWAAVGRRRREQMIA
ncbi:MAG: hypothetical protein WD225_10050, partial [Ilumatobacteraceae bacterium]